MKYAILTSLLLLAACGDPRPVLCDTPEAAKCGKGDDRQPFTVQRPEQTTVIENDGTGLFWDRNNPPEAEE